MRPRLHTLARAARAAVRALRRNPVTRLLVKLVVTVVGLLVLTAGLLMLVAPGPAFVVLPTGLAILATEWPWARRLLNAAKAHAKGAASRVSRWRGRRGTFGADPVGQLAALAAVGLLAGLAVTGFAP